MLRRLALLIFMLGFSVFAFSAHAENALRLGIGLFQPDKEKNDATYRPLADYLSQKLGRKVQLRTVDSWEGLAKSLANGETDIALMGPWGYVLANNQSGAQAVATILYDGKPEYHALIITHPGSGIDKLEDLKGRTFAFGDKGSTSGYLIPTHQLMKMGIGDAEKYLNPGHARRARCRRRLRPQPECDDRTGIDQGIRQQDHLDFGTAAQ
jgi:phosphonate transport system substrate-binding protein